MRRVPGASVRKDLGCSLEQAPSASMTPAKVRLVTPLMVRLAVGPQTRRVGSLDAGVDLSRHLGPRADARRDDLAERHATGRRPGLGIPQLGAHDRTGAVEVAMLDVHACRQQRGLAERAE